MSSLGAVVGSDRACGLSTPCCDVSALFELGVMAIPNVRYLQWADDVGLFRLLSGGVAITCDDVVAGTALSRRGAEAFLGVLVGLRVLTRLGDERYSFSDLGREFLDPDSAYYVAPALYGRGGRAVPGALLKTGHVRRLSGVAGTLREKVKFLFKRDAFGRPERLRVQHSRNFPAAVVAARSGVFDGLNHLVDIGGGTAVFGIPLAADYPHLRITLVDLPRAVPHILAFLREHGTGSRIEVRGHDVSERPWPTDPCDGVLFGNFLHAFADDECRVFLAEANRRMLPGGRVFVHEMLWNDRKDGPLLTALWNFWLTTSSAGRQRTAGEVRALLSDTGFGPPMVTPTAGAFSIVSARKMREP